jgi:hypothetical protein
MSNAEVFSFSEEPPPPTSTHLRAMLKNCDDIATAQPGDTHVIASLLQKMMVTYYSDVRKQAMQSFWSALAAAGIGMLFFFYAIWQTMPTKSQGVSNSSWIGIAAGTLTQFISGVNFYLYFKAARQFASFHICLERTNRFLLANTISESLHGPARDEARRALVDTIAAAPMLTLETVTGKT